MLPFNAMMQRSAAKTHNLQPELFRYQRQMRLATEAGDMIERQRAMMAMNSLYSANGINPIVQLVKVFPSMLVFVSYMGAIRGFANAPIEGFETGGALWLVIRRIIMTLSPAGSPICAWPIRTLACR